MVCINHLVPHSYLRGPIYLLILQHRFIDEDQLVVNLKKVEQELKWPDIDESWESLTSGITQLLTGISVHIVGDSTDINEAVAKEIAEGIGSVLFIYFFHSIRLLSKQLDTMLCRLHSRLNIFRTRKA